MSFEKAIGLFESLAKSQRLYGRLLRDLNESEEIQEALRNWCDGHPETDNLDLILAIEG